MPYSDRVVLVTGGTRGIGKSIVTEFVEKNVTIVINYNNDDEGTQSLRQELLKKEEYIKLTWVWLKTLMRCSHLSKKE